MRGAAAHAAAAADRAAATPFGGLPVPIHTPGNGEGPAEPRDGALDIIDALEGRIRAGIASGEVAANPTESGPGNDRAAEAGREVAVSPALAQAAKRLVSVGCPPLRVEKRYGGLLALHLLQSKDTFTAYAESKSLSGSALREVMTIARALDLATQHQGAQYLMSPPAEVQLRRFYSVILASKLGSFKLSQHLEELPDEGALAELPQFIVREMSEALKLELNEDGAAGGGHEVARRHHRSHSIAEVRAGAEASSGATAAVNPQAGSTVTVDRLRDLFPIPRLPAPPAAISRGNRATARARRRVRVQELANSAIDALNELFAPSDSAKSRAARDAGASPAAGSRIHEAQKYII